MASSLQPHPPLWAQATLFHLVAYAGIKMLHARPGLNRFVSGGRIYQRKGVWLSFAAKVRFTDEAPLTTVKLPFAAAIRFDECVDAIAQAVNAGRSGQMTRTESEVRLLNRLPAPLLRAVIATVRGLDRCNLLPAALIEPDPLYSSMFLANLGSIHIGNAYHHLYEHGTCSLFGVVGAVKKILAPGRDGQPEVRQVLQAQWSFDERVNDGFYCVESLEMLRRVLEDPQRYVDGEAWQAFTEAPGFRRCLAYRAVERTAAWRLLRLGRFPVRGIWNAMIFAPQLRRSPARFRRLEICRNMKLNQFRHIVLLAGTRIPPSKFLLHQRKSLIKQVLMSAPYSGVLLR